MKLLKRALADCMQEETNQVQKKLEREGRHAFSKPFIEKRMQFVFKTGKAGGRTSRKEARGRLDGPVWQHACIVCVVCGRRKLGRATRGDLKMSQEGILCFNWQNRNGKPGGKP
ncbi:MAG: hypothetical protein ACLUD0_09315 [Eubacterium ramulus]